MRLDQRLVGRARLRGACSTEDNIRFVRGEYSNAERAVIRTTAALAHEHRLEHLHQFGANHGVARGVGRDNGYAANGGGTRTPSVVVDLGFDADPDAGAVGDASGDDRGDAPPPPPPFPRRYSALPARMTNRTHSATPLAQSSGMHANARLADSGSSSRANRVIHAAWSDARPHASAASSGSSNAVVAQSRCALYLTSRANADAAARARALSAALALVPRLRSRPRAIRQHPGALLETSHDREETPRKRAGRGVETRDEGGGSFGASRARPRRRRPRANAASAAQSWRQLCRRGARSIRRCSRRVSAPATTGLANRNATAATPTWKSSVRRRSSQNASPLCVARASAPRARTRASPRRATSARVPCARLAYAQF